MSHSPRASVYGRVKEAVLAAGEAGLTVNEASALYGLKKRSIRSVADKMGVKMRPMRQRKSV
jgi:hypothetical protein